MAQPPKSPKSPRNVSAIASPELCLVVTCDVWNGPNMAQLKAFVQAITQASLPVVSLRLDLAAGPADATDDVAEVVRVAQDSGLAVVISDNADLAKQLGADGVHLCSPWHAAAANTDLPDIADGEATDLQTAARDMAAGNNVDDDPTARLRAAQTILDRNAIIGVEISARQPEARHAAMMAGEANASYLAYRTSEPEDLALLHWWSEVFEIPAVAQIKAGRGGKQPDLQPTVEFLEIEIDAGNLKQPDPMIETLKRYTGGTTN